MTNGTICLACQHANRNLARFCEQCGERLSRVSRPAIELRQGTVVFCDLVGSGLLSVRLDSDALVNFYAGYWRFVSETARRYAGYVNRTEGDGAFLLFGYPAGSEDAAECAIRTGLDLIRGIKAQVALPGVPLAVRVGAASGTVVMAGAIEAAMNKELALLGPVPDRAARLTALASPGSIFVDAETRRVAGRFFAYRDRGVYSLKNIARKVAVWEALAETAIVSRFNAHSDAASRGPTAPIGREAELSKLRESWEAARGGTGQVVWISGEPGIGKSSLASYFGALLPADAILLEVQCMARSERSPLAPIGALLKRRAGFDVTDAEETRLYKARESLVGLLAPEGVDDALDLLAGLLGLSVPSELASIDPDALRQRTDALLCELLSSFARRGASLLLCEDLHWADPSTASLLSRVASVCAALPMMVLITSRSPPTPTSGTDSALFTGCESIELKPLDDRQAASLVRRVAPEPPLSDQQVAAVVARAEGLPLVLEELALDVQRDAGAAIEPDRRVDDGKNRVPRVLKAIVQGRIDRSPSVIPIVHMASVLGRQFSLQLMMNASAEMGDLTLALAATIDLGLLQQVNLSGAEMLQFKHGLIQEAVYDSMLASRKKELHARVASLLKSGRGLVEERTPDALAHHLLAAEHYAEGVLCLCEAAFATASRAAYVESRAYAEQGLQWVDRVGVPDKRSQLNLMLLSAMGAALSALLGYGAPEVEETYRKARSLCSEGGDATALFPIARGLGAFYFVRGQMEAAGALATQCVELASKAQVPDFQVEALSFRGYIDCYLGEAKKGRIALEEAVRHGKGLAGAFRYTTPQHPVSAALALLGNAAWAQGDPDAAEEAVRDALAFAQQLNRPFDLAYVHGWVAGLRNLQRRWDEAQHHAQQCYAVSEKYALRIWLATATMQGCIAAVSKAPAPEALALLQASLQGFLVYGAEINSGYFRWGIARGQRLVDDVEGARRTVEQALEHVDRTDEAFIRGELLILAAELESRPARIESLFTEALYEGINVGAPTLALRAGLALLRHRGGTTADPQRDLAAQRALDGQAPHGLSDDWIQAAWAGVREALRVEPPWNDVTPMPYQRSPSSMVRVIEH